jgi:DNA-binding CsgD family transcriptional regulator
MKAPTSAPPFERRKMALLSPLPLRGNRRASSDARGRSGDPALTPRQREVLDRLMRGLANKEIAAELGVGPDAVKRVISRLLVKLDAPSRAALVRNALQTDAARRGRSREPNALSILDAVPIPAIVTRGAEHRVEYLNRAAAELFAAPALGTRLADLVPLASRRAVERIAGESFSSGSRRIARGVLLGDSVTARRDWRLADLTAAPIFDGAGELAGLAVFLVDVSSAAPAHDV